MKACTTPLSLLVALGLASSGCEGDPPVTRPPSGGAAGDADVSGADAVDATLPEVDAKEAVVPGDLLKTEAMRSPEQLNLQVKGANVKMMDDPAGVWLVPFAFRSHVWHGNPWDHPAVLYVPQALAAGGATALVVMQQGTPDLDSGLGTNIDDDFGARTAAQLGLPVLVLGQVPDDTMFSPQESATLSEAHPECFNRLLQQGDLDECAVELTVESKNPKWSLTVAMAKSYLRAITAVDELDGALAKAEVTEVPALSPQRVVLAGAGRRGRALWFAAAADDRVAGIYVAGADAGDLPRFWELVAGVSSKSAEQDEAAAWIELLDGPLGGWWQSMEDPAALAPALGDRPALVARGTNDPTSPVGATALYVDALPAGTQVALVDGYGLGVATPKHLEAFRGFVASTLLDRPRLRVEATWATSGTWTHTVEAALEPEGGQAPTVESIHAWYTDTATVDDADLRDAAWASVELKPAGTDAKGRVRYKGEVQTLLGSWAGYVELRTSWEGVTGLVTTPAHVE